MWLGIMTFGDSATFDRLYVGVLIFTAIVCRKNINVLGVILIMAIHQILGESAWFIYNSIETFPPLAVVILFYSFALYACYKLRHDQVSWLLIISVLIAISNDVYLHIQSEHFSSSHWYVLVLTINLLTRHLIFLRVGYTDNYSSSEAKSIDLDWQLYKINALAIFILTANVTEYALRKTFHMVELLYVYNLYPYLMQIISTYTIFIIFNESSKLIIPKLLKA